MHSWSLSTWNELGVVNCLDMELFNAYNDFLLMSSDKGNQFQGSNLFDFLGSAIPRFVVATEFCG
jgi:hypothetical protein